MNDRILTGKTAVVMGGSAGMGLATARLLAEDGASVLITGRRKDVLANARERLVSEIPGAHIETHAGDACDEAVVKATLRQAHKIAGRLDILVSTVGGADYYKPLLLMEAETFMNEYKLNLISNFLLVKHGVPLMKPGGSIVFLSTATVVQPMWGLSSYGAAKAGLERFVKSAALELGGAGIRVNSVRPGFTRTEATGLMFESGDLVERFAAGTPLGRTGEAEDVARVVRFMAGPESGWVTGENISADGGQNQGIVPDVLDEVYGKEVMDQVRTGKVPESWGN